MDINTDRPSPWPAPGSTTASMPDHADAPPDETTRTWGPPQLSAAGWLAATGASLLLVASIIVVAGNWQSIDPEIRFSGLVASLVAVYFAAEAGRRRIPSTSRALATLAAALTAPVGIAAAATLGQPWPVCTLVGGIAALAATELQSRRWDVPVLEAATVVAFGLAAVGLAALTSIPAPLIGAVGASAALLLGSVRRSVTLAVAVGLSPIVATLADAGVGPGTMARLGMTGAGLTWSAPVSCAIAATVIAVIAQRRSNQPLAVVALATFASGLVTGLVAGDAGPYIWWSLSPIALLAIEAIGATSADSVWRRLARTAATPLGLGIAVVALALPYIALWSSWLFEVGDPTAVVPVGLAALGLVASAVGSSRRNDWSTVAVVAAAAAGFAALVLGGLPLWIGALGALGAWAIVSAATPWRTWDLTTATMASWAVLAVLLDDAVPVGLRVVLVVVAGIAVTISVSVVRRTDEGFRLILSAGIVAVAVAALPTDDPVFIGTAIFAALIALGVSLRPDRSLWPLVSLSLIGLATIDDEPTTWSSVVLTGIIALAYAGASRRADDPRIHVAAALATVTGGLALAASGVDAGTATMAGVVVGTALSGIALLDRRLLPALTAGLSATGLAVVASSFAGPVFVSIAVTMFGAQLALAGAVWRGRAGAVPGAVIAVTALCSSWWTTGTNDWTIDAIAPYGATGVDIVVGFLATLVLIAGRFARRNYAITSWLAYGPGLALAGSWLLASQLETGADWATFGALAIGVVALGIGGWRRLGAPLVAGTIMIGGTILLSAGPRLATTPTWTWIAAGGVGLLVVAALIERSERPLLPIGRRAQTKQSLLERFYEEFG